MRSLEDETALPIRMEEESGELFLAPPLEREGLSVRNLEDARPTLADTAATGPRELYWMHRGVRRPEDSPQMAARGLRYDLTVLRPGRIGREYVKTVGHYHPVEQGSGLPYPEVYQVITGEAHYLLQQRELAEGLPGQALLVRALPGEVVVIPPGYGHITINAGAVPLLMANWVFAGFESLYEPVRRLHGALYYILEGLEALPNPHYAVHPPLRRSEARELPGLGLRHGIPLYRQFQEAPDAFHFLRQPGPYRQHWAGLISA